MARTPHGYHDIALIRSDLAKAGFTDVTIETRAAREPRRVCPPCCAGLLPGHPVRNEIEARGNLEVATEHAASALARRHGSGEVAAKIQAHVIQART